MNQNFNVSTLFVTSTFCLCFGLGQNSRITMDRGNFLEPPLISMMRINVGRTNFQPTLNLSEPISVGYIDCFFRENYCG